MDEATEKAKIDVMALLRETIRPEFLNRVDEIIMFHPLMRRQIKGIVRIQLEGLKKLLLQNGIQLEFSDYILDYLGENGYDPQYGARPLKRLIQKEIVNPLSKKILAGDIDKSQPVLVDVFDNVVVFRNEPAAPSKWWRRPGNRRAKDTGLPRNSNNLTSLYVIIERDRYWTGHAAKSGMAFGSFICKKEIIYYGNEQTQG